MNAIGRLFNVVQNASGVAIPLTRSGGVTFVTFEEDGSTIATFTEVDSRGVETEQALDVDFEPFKGPGIGGTWTAMAEQDSTVDLGDDATNDSMVLSVNAEQLSTGYDSVECTVDGGVVTAIIHDLTVQRYPANLASSIVA
jgi:hypothetical protein|tara:strand:- start:506 stop:928 length:423 start_codon:yes stop_codon:yes gene_type:complete